MDRNEFLKALVAAAPDHHLNEEDNLFGCFAGEWEFDWYGYEPGMEAQHEKGEWIFSWILEGLAMQDVWIIPGRDRRHLPGFPAGEYGTTIRFFNEKKKAWQVAWAGPVKGRFHTFEARRVEDEIVMEETSANDFKMKWIFSEIMDESFNWRSIISVDDGKSWKLVQKMVVKRKSKKGKQMV